LEVKDRAFFPSHGIIEGEVEENWWEMNDPNWQFREIKDSDPYYK
jgi:hypothetical protein